MLIDFSISNYGPFRDRATLSMHAADVGILPDNSVPTDEVQGGLLTSAIVFGPNASGKTYLYKAFRSLKYMVRDIYEEGYRYEWYEPFRLSKTNLNNPVEMEIRLLLNGIIYDYCISFNTNSVVKESLHHYPNGRRVRVFVRNGPHGEYKGGKKRLQSMTTGSASYLAVAAKFNDSICDIVRKAIESIVVLPLRAEKLANRASSFALENPERKTIAIKMLQNADFGIADFKEDREEISIEDVRNQIPPEEYEQIKGKTEKIYVSELSLKHNFPEADVDSDKLEFPFAIESTGTQFMMGLMGPLIDVLTNGSVLVVDELGSSLHPDLTRWIVRLFSGDSNPHHAQLIANSHEIGLIDQHLLRRDQIWLVERDRKSGASELYSIADFEGVFDNTDILKAYVIGRYGAKPIMSQGI